MSPAKVKKRRGSRRSTEETRIHLPSIHIRNAIGNGYDYEEDLYQRGLQAVLVVTFAFVKSDEPGPARITSTVLADPDLAMFGELLPTLMEEGNPDAEAFMRDRAADEYERQLRILAGVEAVCAGCGCSQSRACSGGCCWATKTLCSRCV